MKILDTIRKGPATVDKINNLFRTNSFFTHELLNSPLFNHLLCNR
ncbi:hypothetical protein XNC3_2150017 [Xenorhabdus nematophila F1]|nr:hypothetical protein XNC3_2150017 [Xenorhabdus nematophila F1]CEF33069.1 hypothetical protein XNW1_4610022 [Xenorhabdus nematophila str. Websteri]CEK24908.1 protein of unknown function [Xenorhabdus nematophila AN6/1]